MAVEMVDLSLRIYHRFHDNLDAFAAKAAAFYEPNIDWFRPSGPIFADKKEPAFEAGYGEGSLWLRPYWRRRWINRRWPWLGA